MRRYDIARLRADLAAYTPTELAEFCETMDTLLDAADDGSTAFSVFRQILTDRLATAVKSLADEGEATTVVDFPTKPNWRPE